MTENQLFKLGLALSKENDYLDSEEKFNKVLSLNPTSLVYQVALAELFRKQNQFERSIEVYNSIKRNNRKGYKQITLYHANTLLLAKQNQQAIDLLNKYIQGDAENPLAHIFLARAYGELGLLPESYLARSEYHYLRGNLTFAIKQLDNASRYTENEFIKKDIENKKKRFRRELGETKASLQKL